MLVSTEWLHEHLHDADIRLFDCTGCINKNQSNEGKEEHYNLHHIPNAAYLDVANPFGEMSDSTSKLPFTWPNSQQLHKTLERLGVTTQNRIILYSAPNPQTQASGFTWATRAWWILHHYGFNCAILDGGWNKWCRENRPITTDNYHYPKTELTMPPLTPQKGAVNRDEVLTQQSHQGHIIDSLSPESFSGNVDRAYGRFGKRKGHISGAINIHFEDLINPEDDTYLSRSMLHRLYTNAGINLNEPIITYCGGGIGATATAFALKLIGAKHTQIYDGSLYEWSNDPSLPMTDLSLTHA